MADEKKERWLSLLALTTVIFAVCATLSTFKGGGYSTRSVLSQSQASDMWAYYQSKSIKGYIFDIQREKLELELKAMGRGASAGVREGYEGKIESYAEKTAKYEGEKARIEKDARALEHVRDDAQLHARAFGEAVIYLQIAILLSSIAALLKKKTVYLLGLAVGVYGVVHFANGFLLFIG